MGQRVLIAARWLRTLRNDPSEAVDRWRTRRAAKVEGAGSGSPQGEDRAWCGLARILAADAHEVLEGFDEVWADVTERLRHLDAEGARDAHDADPELARALWVIVRARRPERVLETGVARGVTSAVVLSALERNGVGTLTSIDLPPLADPWYRQSGALVSAELRPRWCYVRGDARRLVPSTLVELGAVDLFIHDSLHTYGHMKYELELAARFLSPGGVMVADDIDANAAFDEVASHQRFAGSLRGRHSVKRGAFGVAWKPSST